MDGVLDFFNVYIMGSIEILTAFYFFTRFLKKRVRLMHYVFFMVFGIAVMAAFPFGGVMGLLAYVLLFIAAGIFICKADKSLSALYAVVTIGIMNLCYGVFHSVSFILSPFVFAQNPGIVCLMFMGIGSVLSLIVSVLCYRIIDKSFALEEEAEGKCIMMILLPVLLVFLVSEYIHTGIYGNEITIEADGTIPDVNSYPVLFVQLLGIGSLFCILYAYRRLADNFKLKKEVSLLEMESHSLYQYVEEAKIRYENTRAFRHDVKNHIAVVKELLQGGNVETALQYMGDMENMTVNLSFPVNTNHPVLDILLGNRLGIAKQKEIEVQCSFHVPYPCRIRDIDFCIILSNALDNAILACDRVRDRDTYIHVMGKVQGDFILIEIENSSSGTRCIHRGTGLSNIEAVAKKYHGAMDIRAEGEKFVLSVLLIIPQQPEGISQQVD